ncbi:PAS domain-containing protein [Parvularcula sp. ZS-1/3]|uniref:histidine kinase n=1 Tax=Parvularcula mediterranea TaxID=2732508 RepID=A0A7Y3W4X1_9PROT|nr:PAS domain-containing protein [Parvularcula mediterranea]NNU15923.1 PAS domain-containing protein [Parvularcula mediterranea]
MTEMNDALAGLPEGLVKTMIAQTRMAMTVTDARAEDNPIVFANPAFLQLTGYSAEEVIGRNCRFLQGEETDRSLVAQIRETVEKREFGYFELLNYRKDGTPFRNALHISPVYNDQGELTHFFGSQWEVVEKEKSNSRAFYLGADQSDRSQLLEYALDQATDSLLLTEYEPLEEPGPKILWASRGFERMTGYTNDEVVGRSPRFLQGPETDREALDRLKDSLERGVGHSNTRTVNYRKNGDPFWIEWSVSPVRGTDGEPHSWLAVQRDVTKQVELTQERERLLAELDHRTRNLFGMAQVLVRGAEAEDGTAEGLRRRLLYQFQALSSAHALVYSMSDTTAEMGDIAAAVLQSFDPDETLIARDGDSARLDGKQGVNAAIIIYELAALSAERGALSKKRKVSLFWHQQDGELRMTWAEDASLPEASRFGVGLVKTFVRASDWDDAAIEETADSFTVRLSFTAAEEDDA